MTDDFQALNYSSHAIEDLESLAMSLDIGGARLSARSMRGIVEMLKQSVKFLLPNGAEMIDAADFKQVHLDMARLPFPIVAFEAPWHNAANNAKEVAGIAQSPSLKRIALCWESDYQHPALPSQEWARQEYPEGGKFVLPIFWSDEAKRWMTTFAAVFVPNENKIGKISDFEGVGTKLAAQGMEEAGLSRGDGAFTIHTAPIFPELLVQLRHELGSMEKAEASVILDCHDEVRMMVQACSVMNCANITTVDVEPPAALNKKRAKNGKAPCSPTKSCRSWTSARTTAANPALAQAMAARGSTCGGVIFADWTRVWSGSGPPW